MKRHYRVLASFLVATMTACASNADKASGPSTQTVAATPVTTILFNGPVLTMLPDKSPVQALAITNGVITAVGDTNSILSLAGSDTEMIDLKGNAVLPGFYDNHVHPLYGGILGVACSIPQGAAIKELQSRVSKCVEGKKAGEWVTGGQWDASALGKAPNKSMLDAVSKDIPITLLDTSAHSLWVNSKALEIAGITSATEDPPGGIIERDGNGNPTGVLREMAVGLVQRHAPAYSAETLRSALEAALEKMLSVGITSFSEASLGFVAGANTEMNLWMTLAEEGVLKQHARICMLWTPGDDSYKSLLEQHHSYASGLLKPDCIKIVLDGVPTDSHTAAMLAPYEDTVAGRSSDEHTQGMLLVDPQILNKAVTQFDGMGLTVKFHAAGDAAVRASLDAIEAAKIAHPESILSHNVAHVTFIAKEDIKRAGEKHITLELSPYLWSPSPINDDITLAVGNERIKRVWPFREIIDAGVLAVPGSDWAVVASVNPWLAVEELVTREKAGGSKQNFGKQQAIALWEALTLFTVNSSEHMGLAGKSGIIAKGAAADLIVIDRNPFTIPVTELHQVEINRTIIQGKTAYLR